MHCLTRKSAGTPTRDLEFGREVAFPFVSSLLGNFAPWWSRAQAAARLERLRSEAAKQAAEARALAAAAAAAEGLEGAAAMAALVDGALR